MKLQSIRLEILSVYPVGTVIRDGDMLLIAAWGPLWGLPTV